MRYRDTSYQRKIQRSSPLPRTVKNSRVAGASAHLSYQKNSQGEEHEAAQIAECSQPYSSISTERIMQAVEQQRRITQQLDHIRSKQQQKVALLDCGAGKFALVLDVERERVVWAVAQIESYFS